MTLFGRPLLELPKGFANGGRERNRFGSHLKEEVGNGRNGYSSPYRWKAGQRRGDVWHPLRPRRPEKAACRVDTFKLRPTLADSLTYQRSNLQQVCLIAAREPPRRDNRIAITAKQSDNANRCGPKLKQTTTETPTAVNLEANLVAGAGNCFDTCPRSPAIVIPPLFCVFIQACRTNASMGGIAHE